MKFSTETLKQVSELLIADWTEQELDLQEMEAAEVERHLQEGLQDVGRLALQGLWEKQDEALHKEGITCEHKDCQGKVMKRVVRRRVQVTSLWGLVRYRRGEYVCERGHRKAALDAQQRLRPGQPTPHLEMLLGLSGAAMPFEQGEAWVQTWLQVEISPNTIRRATHTLGERQVAWEQSWYAESESQKLHRERLAATEKPPKRVYASIDGAFAPMRKGQNGTEDWREAKAVAWYQEGCSYGSEERRATQVATYGTLEDKEGFGKLLWASGYHYGADLAEELVVVSDGAAWIWDLIQTYYPKAVQILDWTHACSYLHAIQSIWTPQETDAAEQWLADTKQLLWEGEVQSVIARCRTLAAANVATAAAATTAAAYFERHAQRMDYAHFREQGYFIGSGTIESGVKRLVGARLKIAGARWNMTSGEKTLKARCVFLNRSWYQLPLAS